MEKLKTLKDLEWHQDDINKPVLKVKVDELKAEAIKWVKEFQKERTDAISEMFDNVDKYGIYPTTKFFNRIDSFWMDRLNITEEDLK